MIIERKAIINTAGVFDWISFLIPKLITSQETN